MCTMQQHQQQEHLNEKEQDFELCGNCDSLKNVLTYAFFSILPFAVLQVSMNIGASSWTYLASSSLFLFINAQLVHALFRPISLFPSLVGFVSLLSISLAFTIQPLFPPTPSAALSSAGVAPFTGNCTFTSKAGHAKCAALGFSPAASGPHFRPTAGYFAGETNGFASFSTSDLDKLFTDFNKPFDLASGLVTVPSTCFGNLTKLLCETVEPTCDSDCGFESVKYQTCLESVDSCRPIASIVDLIFTSPAGMLGVVSSFEMAREPSLRAALWIMNVVHRTCHDTVLSPGGRRSGQSWTGFLNTTGYFNLSAPAFVDLSNGTAKCSTVDYQAYLDRLQLSSSSDSYASAALQVYNQLDFFQRKLSLMVVVLIVLVSTWLELLARYAYQGGCAFEMDRILAPPNLLQWARLSLNRRFQLIGVFAIGCISIVICFYVGFAFDVNGAVSVPVYSVVAFLVCLAITPFLLRNFFAHRDSVEKQLTLGVEEAAATTTTIELFSPTSEVKVPLPVAAVAVSAVPLAVSLSVLPASDADGAASETESQSSGRSEFRLFSKRTVSASSMGNAASAAESEATSITPPRSRQKTLQYLNEVALVTQSDGVSPITSTLSYVLRLIFEYRQLYRETFGYNGTYILYKLVFLECVEIALQLASLQDASTQTHTPALLWITSLVTVNMCPDMILFDLSFDTFYNLYYLFAYAVSDMTPIRFVSVIFTCLSSVQTLIDVALYMQHIDEHRRSASSLSPELTARFKNVANRALHIGEVPLLWLRYAFHLFGALSVAFGALLSAYVISTLLTMDQHCGAFLGSPAAWAHASPRVYFVDTSAAEASDSSYVVRAPASAWQVLPGMRPTCRFELVTRWDASSSGLTVDALVVWPQYLSSLTWLTLANNGLNSVPSSWRGAFWPSLHTLDLSNNRVAFLPPSFFNTSLQTLILNGNPIARTLDWSRQNLSSLPRLLPSLAATLESLNLSGNSLSEFDSPASSSTRVLQRLCRLTELDVSSNKLVSPQWSALSCTQASMKRRNNYTAFPMFWTNLEQMDLSFNNFLVMTYYDVFGSSNESVVYQFIGNSLSTLIWRGGSESVQYCNPALAQCASTVQTWRIISSPYQRLSPNLALFTAAREVDVRGSFLETENFARFCALPLLSYVQLLYVAQWPSSFAVCTLDSLKTLIFTSKLVSGAGISLTAGLTSLATVYISLVSALLPPPHVFRFLFWTANLTSLLLSPLDVATYPCLPSSASRPLTNRSEIDACLQPLYGLQSPVIVAYTAAAERVYGVPCAMDVNLRVLCGLKCPVTARPGVIRLLNLSASASSGSAPTLSTWAELDALYPIDPSAYYPSSYPYRLVANASRLIAPVLNGTYIDTLRWDRVNTTVTVAGFRGALTPWGVRITASSPLRMPMNAWCEWSLQAPVGARLNLTVAFMDLQPVQSAGVSLPCFASYVNVFDGPTTASPLLLPEAPHYGHLCAAAALPGARLVSSGNVVTVRFVSSPDGPASDAMSGFVLEWAVVSA